MSWPRVRTYVGKLAPEPGTGGGPAPTQPTLIASEVSASGQRFRLTASSGFQIDQATVIAEVTVSCTAPDGFLISNRTTTSFEVNTQEQGPAGPFGYTFGLTGGNVIKTPQGDVFALTGIQFSIGSNNAIDQWAQT